MRLPLRRLSKRTTVFVSVLAIVFLTTASVIIFYVRPVHTNNIYAFDVEAHDQYFKTYVARERSIIGSLPAGDPQVSPDDKFVIASTNTYGVANASNFVYSYDVDARKIQRLRLLSDEGLSCKPQVTDDDHVYVPDPSMTRYQLPGFSNPIRLTLRPARGKTLPTQLDTITSRICPVGHIGNDVLGFVYSQKGGYLYRISPTGVVHQITNGTPITPPDADPIYLSAITDRTAASEPGFAYMLTGTNASESIHVINPVTGAADTTDLSALSSPQSRANGNDKRLEIGVHDLSWGLDGHLYAVMGSWLDLDNGLNYNVVEEQSLWRLDGPRWTSVGSRRMVRIRQLNADTDLIIVPRLPSAPGGGLSEGQSGGINRGVLYVRTDGRTYKVFDKNDVFNIAVPQLK